MTTLAGTNVRESYARLVELSRKAATLASCGGVLHWDRETCMPPGGAEYRAEQLALVAGMVHDIATSREFGELISACEGTELAADPLSPSAVNIRELRRDYDKAAKLPKRLVEELTRVASLSHQAWVDGRRTSDFKLFLPWLEKIVALNREKAEAFGYDAAPYDPLLDQFEPGATVAEVNRVFAGLAAELAPLIERAAAAPRQPDPSILARSYPVERQKSVAREAAAAIGFDFNCGRIDTVTHPFCSTLGPGDTRITTRYNERFFGAAFFGTMHEAGHGLYGQGALKEHHGTPMGMPVSLGIHESQSRMWENFVGRGRPFWTFFFPKAKAAFPESLGDVSLDAFLHAVNAVRPSYIRVEADEATYNLHVILRFELEQALVSGSLRPADVPAAWNRRFKEILGLDVPDDSRGCLQDVHWSLGHLGYFPTYCLGNLVAAQIFARAKEELPGLEASFERGDFKPLLDWLRTKIHTQGRRYRASELVEKVTGRPLGHEALIAHLKDKFSLLYGL